MLANMGLTAARFDLLYAVRGRRRGMPQSVLQRVLGVSRATVSRMLASLEALGLVKRTVDPADRRRKRVELTDLGRQRIDFAHKQLTRSGWAQLAIDSALGAEGQAERWWSGPVFKTMSHLDGMLSALRRAFYDTGSLEYPWEPKAWYVEDGIEEDPWEDGEGVI
jgi:DNA-binding MarR family transcriptional regulator